MLVQQVACETESSCICLFSQASNGHLSCASLGRLERFHLFLREESTEPLILYLIVGSLKLPVLVRDIWASLKGKYSAIVDLLFDSVLQR